MVNGDNGHFQKQHVVFMQCKHSTVMNTFCDCFNSSTCVTLYMQRRYPIIAEGVYTEVLKETRPFKWIINSES